MSVGLSETVSVSQSVYVLVICVSVSPHGPPLPDLQSLSLSPVSFSLAEVYIGMGKPAEATACTQEAANLFPMSHNVLFIRGQVAELRGNVDEAKRWYEEALSISPTHVKTMQRLVSLSFLLFPSSMSLAISLSIISPTHVKTMQRLVSPEPLHPSVHICSVLPLSSSLLLPRQPCSLTADILSLLGSSQSHSHSASQSYSSQSRSLRS